MKNIKSRKNLGFQKSALHKAKEPAALEYISHRTSFWIATLSMFAFVVGNMMGQHGWHAFWASVLGNTDDSLIVYTGTVSPIAQVPDYERWAQYGGGNDQHTFRQVPKDLLMDLPSYDTHVHDRVGDKALVYSVGYMGSYDTGEEGTGSHPGIDIRTPEGTPVLAVANGVVTEVKEDAGGFGKVIVIRHPNVPDPTDPSRPTVLYSAYAHLSAMLVTEGMVVTKGEQIGLTGSTGFVSGPHLHFQMDREDAPWHPYWPFSDSEARSAGMNLSQAIDAAFHSERGYEYTINGMLYVQASYNPLSEDVLTAARKSKTTVSSTKPASPLSRLLSRREERLKEREQRKTRVASRASAPVIVSPSVSVPRPTVQVVATHETSETVAVAPENVATVEFRHDGSFEGRSWETLRIRLVDANGATVTNPEIKGSLVLRTAYGDAEFSKETLTTADFDHGEATVTVLPRGQRTIVFQLMPFQSLSSPMRYER